MNEESTYEELKLTQEAAKKGKDSDVQNFDMHLLNELWNKNIELKVGKRGKKSKVGKSKEGKPRFDTFILSVIRFICKIPFFINKYIDCGKEY